MRDQVDALRELDGVEVEVFAFPPGGYVRAARALRRQHRARALRRHPRALRAHRVARARAARRAARGDAPRHRPAPPALAADHPRGAAVRRPRRRRQPRARARGARRRRAPAASRSCPCGVDLDRFAPIPRAEARERLNLAPDEPCLLFPADPARAVKRFDRAQQVAGDTRLLTLGRVHPFEVPLYVNAANAVLVPSAHEGFGLAVLEALACDVPVLATPVGVHPAALDGVAGHAVRAVRSRRVAGRRSRRTCRPPIRASRAATGPRCGRLGGWRDGCSTPGARCYGCPSRRRIRVPFPHEGPAARHPPPARRASGQRGRHRAGRDGGADRGAAHRGPASTPPPAAADQAQPRRPTLAAADRRPSSRRRDRGPRRPGAGPRPPELPPARPPAPAPALPAPRARAGLPRPRRPHLRPAPLLAGQRRRSSTASSHALGAVDARAARARARARRPPSAHRAARAGHLGVLALRSAARQRGPLLPVVRHAGARAARDRRGGRGREPARRRRPARAAPAHRRAAAAGAAVAPRPAARCSLQPLAPAPAAPSRAAARPSRRAAAEPRRRPAARRPPPATRARAPPPTASSRPRSCARVDEQPGTATGNGDGRARVAQPQRRAPRAVSVAPPGAPPAPGTIACPRCATTIGPDQAWCLECGAPARTRLVPTPNWRAPVAVLAVVILLAGIALARGLRGPHERHRARRAGQLAGAATLGHDRRSRPPHAAAAPTQPTAPTEHRGPDHRGADDGQRAPHRRAPHGSTAPARAPPARARAPRTVRPPRRARAASCKSRGGCSAV